MHLQRASRVGITVIYTLNNRFSFFAKPYIIEYDTRTNSTDCFMPLHVSFFAFFLLFTFLKLNDKSKFGCHILLSGKN